ncbi:MAG: hypothetical protein WA081_17065 [Desulfosalsimonadaceae bacterium]
MNRLQNTEEKLALARECIDNGLTVDELKQRIREIQAESVNPPASLAASVEIYLGGINRWLRRVSAPGGMTNAGLISGMRLRKRKKSWMPQEGFLRIYPLSPTGFRQW